MFLNPSKKSIRRKPELEVIAEYSLLEIDYSTWEEERGSLAMNNNVIPEMKNRKNSHRPSPSTLPSILEDEETDEKVHSSLTEVTGPRTSPRPDNGSLPALRPQTSCKTSADKLPVLRVTGRKVCLQQRQQSAGGSAGRGPSQQTNVLKRPRLLPSFAPSKIKAPSRVENEGARIKMLCQIPQLAKSGQDRPNRILVDKTNNTFPRPEIYCPYLLGKRAHLNGQPVKASLSPTVRSFHGERLRPI